MTDTPEVSLTGVEDASSRLRPIRLVAGAVAVALVALLVLLWMSDTDTGITADSPLLAKRVPHLQGETFDGDHFDIDDADARWVVVNFFASWCIPCEQEHPELIEFAARHSTDGLVVSIPFGDTEQGARAFFDRLGGDWPVLKDPKAEFAVLFGVLQPPETFLVAPGGIVVERFLGPISADLIDSYIAEVIRQAEAS